MSEIRITNENDRRIFERVSVELPVSVLASQNNLEFNGTSCDVSAHGLGVVCDQAIGVGSPVEIWLRMHQRKDPFYARGTISWMHLLHNGKQRLGIVFEKAQLMELSAVLRMA